MNTHEIIPFPEPLNVRPVSEESPRLLEEKLPLNVLPFGVGYNNMPYPAFELTTGERVDEALLEPTHFELPRQEGDV